MGNIWHTERQPKELRVIYVQDHKTKRIYPISWPDTFQQLVEELYLLFPQTKQYKTPKLVFEDGTQGEVCVCSEHTFRALVPKHQKVAPAVDLYHVGLKHWITECSTPHATKIPQR